MIFCLSAVLIPLLLEETTAAPSHNPPEDGGIKYNPLSLVCIVVAVCACNECISEGYFSLILLTLSERAVIKVPYTSTPINLLFNCSYDGL